MFDWVAKYIEVPFVPHGRTIDGCDCYGLVRLILNTHFGKNWPELTVGYESTDQRETISGLIEENRPLLDGVKTENPEPGDVVLMFDRGIPCHMGLYLGQKKVIHTTRNRGTVVDRVEFSPITGKIEGYYRVA